MKVYVAVANFGYEGVDIIGVFDNKKDAQAACDNHKYKSGRLRGDSREVEEYELGKVEFYTD